MAQDYHGELRGFVGTPLYMPFPESTTGIVIADFTFLYAAVDGVLYADPEADLSMELIEVDDVAAPGLYFVKIIPTQEGQLFVYWRHTAHDFEYSVEVGPASPTAVSDPSLEGEYTLTVQAPSGGAVQGAVVRVFDAAGTTYVTRGTTDASGEVVFTLPVGNYQIRVFKDGVDFSAINPTTITVTATDSAAPVVSEVLPTEGSIGDTIAIVGNFFDQTSQVLFGAEATVAADHVNAEGTVLLVTVPALTGTIFALRVDKPDPANPPAGKLLSNSVTWTRT